MKITRRFTQPGQDVFSSVQYEKRTSRISNPDGSVVFEMNDAEIPAQWSQLATDIMVSKYFRKAGVPQTDAQGNALRDAQGNAVTGPEKSVKQVVNRLAGCWRYWGEKHGYFDTTEDAQAFYDEMSYMLLHQMCAPNSPQWFNTGLNFAYGITGPAQGHLYCDPKTGELLKSRDAYSHPQPHACQPYHAPVSTPRGRIPIGRIVEQNLVGSEVYDGTREGTGTTRVVAVKANGKKMVHRAVLENGTAIEATGDHLVFVMNSSGLGGRWVRVDSLDKGMQLVHIAFSRVRETESATKVRATVSTMAGEPDGFMNESLLESNPTPLIPTEPMPEVQYLRVVRVKAVGMQNVYDIQTESGQYLSNDVVVHNCFIQAVGDDLVNPGGIMDLWTREARLFKYGSGTGSNFSKVRGENEPLSGGGKSSGLMSFLKIGDRAAGAIKSGGTTRRAAKMVCLDLDHPDVESFVNWKVREELKVAAMVEGMRILPKDQQDLAKKLGLKLDYDFNGESYMTVSGQNSNNSVRIPNRFFKAVEEDGDWHLTWRSNGKVSKTLKARELWDQIAFAAWRCADPGVQYDDTINQWHTCPKSGRINASNPCVTGDTRVLTPGGIWRRIDQMIHLPARIITNLHTQQISTTEGAFPTGTREVFELRTTGGYRVTLTADHKVWTRSRGWIEAQDLRSTDEVRLPSKPACVSEIGEPQDPRFFELLGMLLSDTNGNLDALKLDKCLADSDDIEQFAQYAAENWGDGLYNDDYVNLEMTGQDDEESEGGTMLATLTNRRLLSRLKAYVRSENGAMRLSDEAFTAGLAAQKHLLTSLFTADATFTGGTLELQNSSIGFLEDVQLILLGFGIQAAIVEGSGFGVQGSGQLTQSSSLPSAYCPLPSVVPSQISTQSSELSTEKTGGLPLRPVGSPSGPLYRGDANSSRHGLRIDSGSLRFFADRIGLLPGRKQQLLGTAVSFAISRDENTGHFDRFSSLKLLGLRQVFDLTEPRTSSFVANGLTVHNCSEYMFLDDTACNLASLNVLTFFDPEARRFDVEGFKHGCRLWTIVLEVSVLMASFPSESIARLSYQYRTLGLGYANLGAMLMQAGIPYNSEKGRAICAALSAILTGESYACSAEMARELGAFPMYEPNRADMLRVIRNHRRAAYDVRANAVGQRTIGDYENLDIAPVGIDAGQFTDSDPMAPRSLLASARECWDRALTLGEKHGYRNAQTTVIAPTGTIGLLMDCDTTGVEPDFALVKFKKLAGGGYFKIANQSLRPALVNLGYEPAQIHDILQYVMGTLTLHGAPVIEYNHLKNLGFTDAELDKIEASLPGVFEISFAFSPWTLGADVLKRFDIPESEWQHPNFNFLRRLGFTKKQIDDANDIICGRGTVEGAPGVRDEHLPVFDCANKCGKVGVRYIQVEGHIRMMAAAQPFITGAISKTINLPNDASLDDIKNSYELSWKLGLKANALYRDGSKLSQPLNVKSDEDLDKKTDAEDEEAVAAAREEVARDVAKAAMAVAAHQPITSDNIAPVPHTIEKIVERIVERPLRRRLPDTRSAKTHKFDVAGHEGYITVGLYDDGQPGEVFIRIAKEGSTIGGLMDTIATLVSVSLQYGVPVESLVRKFEHVRFEPSGMTRNPEIPMAKSLVDYIFRWLAMEFVPGFRAAFAPKREKKETGRRGDGATGGSESGSSAAMSAVLPPTDGLSPQPSAPTPKKKEGNGHGPRIIPDTAKSFDYNTPGEAAQETHYTGPSTTFAGPGLRLALIADPLSQQGSEMQADAPACDVCGSITVRSGTCYKCMNCGNSMGCS